MNYTAMTADEEAKVIDTIAKIRSESATLIDSLVGLKEYLDEIYDSKRPDVKPDPNSVYVLNEMTDILVSVVNNARITTLVNDNVGYMRWLSRNIREDLQEAAEERLKDIR